MSLKKLILTGYIGIKNEEVDAKYTRIVFSHEDKLKFSISEKQGDYKLSLQFPFTGGELFTINHYQSLEEAEKEIARWKDRIEHSFAIRFSKKGLARLVE